jgi:outer membrane usher protein
VRSVTGRIRLARGGADIVPAFGRLVLAVEGAEHSSPVGSDGEFFLEQIPPGEHAGRLAFEGDACPFTLAVPTVSTLITDIGVVRCVSAGDEPK